MWPGPGWVCGGWRGSTWGLQGDITRHPNTGHWSRHVAAGCGHHTTHQADSLPACRSSPAATSSCQLQLAAPQLGSTAGQAAHRAGFQGNETHRDFHSDRNLINVHTQNIIQYMKTFHHFQQVIYLNSIVYIKFNNSIFNTVHSAYR